MIMSVIMTALRKVWQQYDRLSFECVVMSNV